MKNKAVLVTGSSSGIGLEIARKCNFSGWDVIHNGRNKDKLNLLKKNSPFQNVTSVQADVTSIKGLQKIYDHTKEKYGKIDGLVCNVGSGKGKPPGEEVISDWHTALEINFFSTLNTIYKLKDLLSEGASIVCISSICGVERIDGAPITYSIAKSALIRFVNDYSVILGKSGFRINCISPGNVLFPGSVWETKIKNNPSDVSEMINKVVPLKMFGKPNDIAEMTYFLLSDEARFITGANFVIDGGQTC